MTTAEDGHERTSPDRRDRALIKLLGRGLTQVEAAAELRMSAKTVQRRMAEEWFRAAVDAEMEAHAGSLVDRLTSLVDRGLLRLEAIVDDDSTPATVVSRTVLGALAELRQRTMPSRLEMSGTVDLDIENMTAEQVRDALEGTAVEIATMIGRTIEPSAGTPTEHTWEVERPAAESLSEPSERPDDPEPVEAAESVSAPQEPSDSRDSGDSTPEPEPEDDAPGNVVPMRPTWQPDPRLTQNPWQDDGPWGTSLYP